MSFAWAALMPHPPLLAPKVGRGREQEAAVTLDGVSKIKRALRTVLADGLPDVLLVLSPHAPATAGALLINSAGGVSGNLARFGAPETGLEAVCDQRAGQELIRAMEAAGIAARSINMADISQDHATIVPLLLIRDSFPENKLPPLLIAGPSGLSPKQSLLLGQCLRGLSGRRWALLASGDLSHRLKKDGPYGLHPDGAVFDRAVIAALEKGDPAPLLDLSPEQRENAAECGLRPVLTLLALAGESLEVFSYEGPFGVGYCNAFWRPSARRAKNGQEGEKKSRLGVRVSVARPAQKEPQSAARTERQNEARQKDHPYPRLARAAIAAHLGGQAPPEAMAVAGEASLWSPRQGCFVSIKNKDGSLRGCIGTFMPTQPGLDREIIANAQSASTRDPRFAPMTARELDGVRISVDVLSEPELVKEGMGLDPKIYGVIVSKDGQRGLLLPDLEGVDSVPQQLAIAASKAGIRDLEGASVSRFTVQRYKEEQA
ncbi:AmmeMemoRadiSam system protein A [Desulfovibrio sp. OttesenSCG-928-G11]|nr:AmmeMemoRadiSam system protein A [Desulfovibrio sp. OttesenSCG-928-G11]